MDDAPDAVAGDADGAGVVHPEEGSADSGELESIAATTLVEVTPGLAVLFGVVPEGIELIGLDLIPKFNREQFFTALSSIGNAGTAVDNISEAISNAQGLYRVNDATLSLLKSGGELAAKDGAKLGAIFKNGELVAQARFIPVSMTAATAIAAIGPAIAMLALQLQLGEVSGLARTNIALTTQMLKVIHNDHWSELEGLAESVDEAIQEACELGSITDTVWESIAPSGPIICKQLKLYQKNVVGHIEELGMLDGRARRQYLESNAEAIVFDAHALLSSLKMRAEYQALKAARARMRSINDETEAQLFDRITQKTLPEIEESLKKIGQLTRSLTRELRIIAELPGRDTMPLTKKHRDAKASQLTCAQLLKAIEPLANMLHPAVEKPTVPDKICAPKGLDLQPYLNVLRWFLEDGEQLRGIAFPYEASARNFTGIMPALLAKRVDAAWNALAPGKAGEMVEIFTSSTFVAVTDRRIITATPKTLLRHGELDTIYPLDEVKYVRPRTNYGQRVRPTIGVTTERSDVQWMFPADAACESIDDLVAVIADSASIRMETHDAIASAAESSSS